MPTDTTLPKFHWSKIPAVKFQYKPSIEMLRGTEEIKVNQSRNKSETTNTIVAIFDSKYVIEVCSRFFNNLLLSDISYDEWKGLCEAIWLSFHASHIDVTAKENSLKVEMMEDLNLPKTPSKSKAK